MTVVRLKNFVGSFLLWLVVIQASCWGASVNNSAEKEFLLKLEEGNLEGVITILQTTPRLINLQNSVGHSTLHLAVFAKDEKAIETLLGIGGIDPSLQDKKYKNTALHYAVKQNNINIVRLLLNKVNNTAKERLLNRQNIWGYTALHYAVLCGYTEIVKILLEAGGMNLRLRDKKKNTLLHLASRGGHKEIMSLILQHEKRLLNITNKYGDTALHEGVKHGHIIGVELLLGTRYINVNLRNQSGDRALDLANKAKTKPIQKLFTKRKRTKPTKNSPSSSLDNSLKNDITPFIKRLVQVVGLLLMGCGLVGLGLYRWFKKIKQSKSQKDGLLESDIKDRLTQKKVILLKAKRLVGQASLHKSYL